MTNRMMRLTGNALALVLVLIGIEVTRAGLVAAGATVMAIGLLLLDFDRRRDLERALADALAPHRARRLPRR